MITTLYGCVRSLATLSGRRAELAAILLDGVTGLRSAGCLEYTVGLASTDDTTIWVHEVWETAQQRDASRNEPAARRATARATGLVVELTSVDTVVAGVLDLPRC